MITAKSGWGVIPVRLAQSWLSGDRELPNVNDAEPLSARIRPTSLFTLSHGANFRSVVF